MKVVYNTKKFGLCLNETEMQMFCKLRGYTLRIQDKPVSSTTTWFNEVDWMEFRTDPLLVRLVEHKMLSNQDLAVHEWDECDHSYKGDWEIETDCRTYESVWVSKDLPKCIGCEDAMPYANDDELYCVYCDPKQFEDEDLTEGEEA
jgi:hypothetical protein